MVVERNARLVRAVLEWDDGMKTTYTGQVLRLWESNMNEGQRLRLAMQALSSLQAQADAGDNDITSSIPETLFEAIMKDIDK